MVYADADAIAEAATLTETATPTATAAVCSADASAWLKRASTKAQKETRRDEKMAKVNPKLKAHSRCGG